MANNPAIASKLATFKAITDKISDGGNLIFASCTSGSGVAGIDFGQNLNKFTGKRLNIFLAQDFVNPRYSEDPGTGQRFVHYSKMFTESFLQTTPQGDQTPNVLLKLNAKQGTPPVTVRKQ